MLDHSQRIIFGVQNRSFETIGVLEKVSVKESLATGGAPPKTHFGIPLPSRIDQ